MNNNWKKRLMILAERNGECGSSSSSSSVTNDAKKKQIPGSPSSDSFNHKNEGSQGLFSSPKGRKYLVTKPKKKSKTFRYSKIQNVSISNDDNMFEEYPIPKANRNMEPNNRNIDSERIQTMSPSSSQKYIQFSVNYVYAAIPYNKNLKCMVDVTGSSGINIIDSKTMKYIQKNASLVRSNLSYSILTSDKEPTQENFGTDVHSRVTELQRSFNELRTDILSTIEKNRSYILKSYEDSATLKKTNIKGFGKVLKEKLPSQSVVEFEKLNRLLLESQEHRLELLSRYKVVIAGEMSVKNCISKIMSHTMTKAVQSAYSGSGKKFRGVKKLDYSKTAAYQCLKDVLEEKFGVQHSELKQLKGRVGQWLANYVSRNK